MKSSGLHIVGLERGDLAAYTARQLHAIAPVGSETKDRDLIEHCLDKTLERLALPTEKVAQWRQGEFDPLLSSQHASFLYLLSNTIWQLEGDAGVPTKLFLLNKALHGVEVYFKTLMPDIFLFVHTVGIVLVNTTYGNYFTVFQNSTVGRVGSDCPTIGAGVVMFANSAVIGRSRIGNRTVLSHNARVVNADVSDDFIVFPSTGKEPSLRAGSAGIIDRYYRNIAL